MRRIYLLLLILFILLSATKPTQAFTAQDATQNILLAETASQNAYISIRAAQLAGANTTTPTALFNQGLNLLEKARSVNATSDYNTAVNNARMAVQFFTSAQNSALDLKSQADSADNLRSILAVASTIISAALVTVGFHFFEKWQHRRWLKNLPEMRIILKEEEHEDR